MIIDRLFFGFFKTRNMLLCAAWSSLFMVSQANDRDTLYESFITATDDDRVRIFENKRDEEKSWFIIQVEDSMAKSIKRLEKSENDSLLNRYRFAEAKACFGDHKYDKAIPLLWNLIRSSKTFDLNDSISLYYYLKQSYFKSKNFYKALDLHKTIEALIARGKDVSPWMLQPAPSQIYYELGLYYHALDLLQKEFEFIPQKYRTDYMMAGHNNNMGIYWHKIGNTDSSLKYFHKAQSFVSKIINGRKSSDPEAREGYYFSGLIYGNIGQVLMLKKKYDEAIPLLQNDVYYSNKIGQFENSAISYNELGECFIHKKDYELASLYLDSAYHILSSKNDIDALLQNIKTRSKLLRALNRSDEGYDMLMEYERLKDSVRKISNEQQLINMQVAYDVEAKEAEINKQRLEMVKASIKSERQNLRLGIAAIGLLILLFVLIVIYVNYRKSKKQHQLLELQNIEIEKQKHTIENSLEEKTMLVREIHHRVKNNLQVMSSLLSIQAEKVENPEMKKLLLENKKRLNTIGLIHQSLYRHENISSVKIQDYIHSLLEQISEFYIDDGREILLDSDIKDINVDLDTAIPLGIILNELVSNSFKHAFKNCKRGKINISLQPYDGNEYLLYVSDTGSGIPENAWKEIEKSLGLELIQLLTHQLCGTLQTENNNGAHFKIFFSPSVVM